MLSVLKLLLALLPGLAPQVPPFVGRCLAQLRPAALEQGAPLPMDSPRGADYGTCAAQCEGHCFLFGDFDGDGKARELVVASGAEALLFQDVERGKGRRFRATPAGRLPLGGEEVALLSWKRGARLAEEVGLLRDGRSPLPALNRDKGERLGFALLLWRGPAEAVAQPAGGTEEEEDHGRGGDAGDLLFAIYDPVAQGYRLQRVLVLGP